MMYFMIGVITFVIGACLIMAGFIITGHIDVGHCTLTAWGWADVIIGMLIIVIALMNIGVNGNKTINKNSTEIEAVTETQTESVTNSAIKVAILKKYPGAEIINTTDSSIGYFLYEQEKYSFESENNILFISKDNKTIDFIYLN